MFLVDSLIAITVCALAVHTGGIRMIFTMGRDGRLPFAPAIARVLAWPRVAVYGGGAWYFQWGAFTFTGGLGLIGVIYYLGSPP